MTAKKQTAVMCLCFVATFIIWIVRLYPVRALTNDDITFLNEYMVHSFGELVDYVSMRWGTWSSRVLIECILLFFLSHGSMLWVVVMALTMTAVPAFLGKYSGGRLKGYVIACMVTLLFPLSLFESAGYITTSINYAVPLVCAMAVLVPFAVKEKVSGKWLPLLILCAIIAGNHEQIAALLIGIIGYCIVVKLIKRESILANNVITTAVVVVEFIICFLCPGNKLRTELEISRWLPEYAEWSVVTKTLHGVAHTLDDVMLLNNIKYIVLLLVVAIAVYALRQKKVLLLLMSVAETVMLVGFNVINLCFGEKYKMHLGFANQHLFLSGRDTLYLLIEIVMFALLIAMLLMIDAVEKAAFKNSVIMLGGFASAFIIGFSPTVYASLDRIYICLVVVMLYEITCLIMYSLNYKKALDSDVT